MSSRDKVLVILAVCGGLGGLVNTLVYSDIVSALNSKRTPGDSIPFALTDLTRKNWEWSYWKVLREFHREFPDSKLNHWSIVSVGWMFLLFAIALGIAFTS
jgi:hypothetical protein